MSTPPFFSLLVLALLVVACASAVELRIPGRCPNICRPHLVSTFHECRTRVNRDCTMTFCGAGPSSRHTACRLRAGGPRQVFPSETVNVQQLNLSSSTHSSATIPLVFGTAPSKTDVYVLIDATASMGGIILSIQEGFEQVRQKVSSSSDAAFGIGIFRDERELSHGFKSIQSITKDATKIRSALGTLEATGGLDAAEANLVALHRVANANKIGWRRDSRRIVIYIADNPGHEPSCKEGKAWLTRETVVNALNKARISVIALSYPYGALDRKPSTFECEASITAANKGQGSFITQMTGGIYAGGRDNLFDATLVIGLISQLSSRISIIKNSCWRHADVQFHPKVPTTLGNWAKLSVTIRPRQSVCRLPGPFTCEMNFLKSGAPVEPFRFVLDKPIGC